MSSSKEHHPESSATKEDLPESSAKKITLKSFDGETFEIEEAVALESKTIKHLIDDVSDDTGIPIPNVTGKILAKVIEYCKKHVESARSNEKPLEDELKKWDAEFVQVVQVDQNTFFDLMEAANYLDIRSLLDLTCKTVADMMLAAKTPEAICQKFNIKNDYSPEEEQKIRSENQWAFE